MTIIIKIKGDKFFEVIDGELYPLNADIYHKEGGRFYSGYRNSKGNYTVYEKDGLLSVSNNETSGKGTPLYKVDLYEDISGRYFPRIEEENAKYFEREDGKIELVKYSEYGSRGETVKDCRGELPRS